MPEEYGGGGGTFAHEAVINREFSLAGFDTFGAPLHSGIVAPYILHYGTEEQKTRFLPGLASGEVLVIIGPSGILSEFLPTRSGGMCSYVQRFDGKEAQYSEPVGELYVKIGP